MIVIIVELTMTILLMIMLVMIVTIILVLIARIPFGDHPFKLERCREDEHGPCARLTRTNREASTSVIVVLIVLNNVNNDSCKQV